MPILLSLKFALPISGGCKPEDFLQQEEMLLFNKMIAAVIGENSGNISY